jgi:hypothetical protein
MSDDRKTKCREFIKQLKEMLDMPEPKNDPELEAYLDHIDAATMDLINHKAITNHYTIGSLRSAALPVFLLVDEEDREEYIESCVQYFKRVARGHGIEIVDQMPPPDKTQ